MCVIFDPVAIYCMGLMIISIGILYGVSRCNNPMMNLKIGDIIGNYIIVDIRREYNDSGYRPYERFDTYDEHETYVYAQNRNTCEILRYEITDFETYFLK